MSGRIKTLLFILLLIAAGAGAIGGSIWWTRGKIDALQKEAAAAEAEAKEFSKTATQRSCQVESIRRTAACSMKSVCEAKANLFFKVCLKESKPVPGFCTGVPPRFKHEAASQRWAAGICAADGTVKKERCMRLQAVLQDFCDTPEPWDDTATSTVSR